MECRNCGASVSEHDQYCMACGAELAGGSEQGARERATRQGDTSPREVANGGAENAAANSGTGTAATAGGEARPGTTDRLRGLRDSIVAGWGPSRKATFLGAALTTVALVLPYAKSATGSDTVLGFEIWPAGSPVPYAVLPLFALLAAYRTWGRGWGWLSMLGSLGTGLILYVFGVMAVVAGDDPLDNLHLIGGGTVPFPDPTLAVGAYVTAVGSVLVLLGAFGGLVGATSTRLQLWFNWLLG
ncbi:zinc ribbon domain-containing protein [Halorientalis salina]|uniref:zinc ribbon domain-containing protein n=1 Tax=Halorientalis salina TaxID=2932266 RepID=UPI0010AD8DF9|nr:zinc ribbon domain-containing protein [Halorientalis salina]